MSQPILNYAPPVPAPVRLHPLALGTAVLALAALFALISRFLANVFPEFINPKYRFPILQSSAFFHGLAALAAVFLFNTALPRPHPTAAPRWQFLACLLAAALLPLAPTYFVLRKSIPVTTVITLSGFSFFLQLVLLTAAALFFFCAARRAAHNLLGIAASAAFLPNLLLLSYFLLFYLLELATSHRSPPPGFLFSLFSLFSNLHALLHFLLWLALTLVTAILALTARRR